MIERSRAPARPVILFTETVFSLRDSPWLMDRTHAAHETSGMFEIVERGQSGLPVQIGSPPGESRMFS